MATSILPNVIRTACYVFMKILTHNLKPISCWWKHLWTHWLEHEQILQELLLIQKVRRSNIIRICSYCDELRASPWQQKKTKPKTVKEMLHSLPSYTVYLSPEAPSNRLWQTDMRVIWRLSFSQTPITSYPTLAPHLGREWIKASVAFIGGETSKDCFAWWDNLVTAGVYVVLKCLCDMAALEDQK